MICTTCQNTLASQTASTISIPNGRMRIHHRTRRSLKRSIELGCYICNRFWACLLSSDRNLVSVLTDSELGLRSDDAFKGSSDGAPINSMNTFFTALCLEEGPPYGHLGWSQLKLAVNSMALVASEMAPGSAKSTIPKRPPQNTKSLETLSLAQSWIADCVANHQQCNKSVTRKNWYPTRLLDCGSAKDSDPWYRLIETKNFAIDGPYMTLSHCWGLADCIKLTTDNYAQMLIGMSSSLLPQLYQDAFYVTRNLGIRYLWIDSLCIIQAGDELADWRHEVALMSHVYSNSFCNISAGDAPDAHHSMLCCRNPDSLCPEIVDLVINGQVTPYLISHTQFWEIEVSRALVNTRAWVLQERLLSCRTLHFGERQLLWECRRKDAAEVYPDGLPPAISSFGGRFKDISLDRYTLSSTNDRDCRGHLVWLRIVQTYTSCGLTFPGDKLVALSAVAKTMAAVLRDEYVAGMWRRYLECELLWAVSGNPIGSPSWRDTYRAPTWSWAASNGAVDPGRPNIEAADLLIEVEDLKLEYVTNDKTGLIRGGWLRLRGVLKQLRLVRTHSSITYGHTDWNMVVNGVHFSALTGFEVQEPQLQVMLDARHENFEEQNAMAALYCMPGRMRRADNDGSIYILLLELVDREKGSFRRIGLARGWGADVQAKILACSVEESKFPCEEYLEGRHLIRII
ncbi:hypothetical protein FOBRF1_000005 [Fusarium oxysporum]